MSQTFARFLHPFEVAHHPKLEPEVERAILASWAFERPSVRSKPASLKPRGVRRAVPTDQVLPATRAPDDRDAGQFRLH
ncbi:hypothetical protein [Novosphingobium sp. P6W]|uniref:hypothetical protein n=1 Tax=Novosphingobium sp. P6W TaxID=1609758 RepID=UPI0005C73F69|nr:hypothetical protein [Novosphingobium sp. P6W]AXB80560.1 hypothetical protein TQ38_026125 [Novosphingobium sp. P6W]